MKEVKEVIVKINHNTFGPFSPNDAKNFLKGYEGGPRFYYRQRGRVLIRAQIISLPNLKRNFPVVPFPF